MKKSRILGLGNRLSLDGISEITCSIKESAVAHYLLFMLPPLLPANYLLGRAAGESALASSRPIQPSLHQGP